MHHDGQKTLVVIGAGPKGLAVAVKAKVYAEFGLPTDRVILVEKHSVAAHWSGEAGYTNGEMKLGTSPEKDVVFPLENHEEKVRLRLMEFSWNAHLMERGDYAEWIDRGRPAPTHRQWAGYLSWVSRKLSPEVSLIKAEVKGIDYSPTALNWELTFKDGRTLSAHRLMLTGPGKTRLDFLQERHEEVYDLESFWRGFTPRKKIAVVGAGENAASVLLALKEKAPEAQVEIITPRGFISTRAENYYENQFYSKPEKMGWALLSLADRRDFIKRTDLGVFSVGAMQVLNEERGHRLVPGRLIGLVSSAEGLCLTLEYDGKLKERTYDQVILATGFDQLNTIKGLFSTRALRFLQDSLGAELTNENLALHIGKDLALEGMLPQLHLPMLAGLRQGPGFANLSCLGLLSDRIMDPTIPHLNLGENNERSYAFCQ